MANGFDPSVAFPSMIVSVPAQPTTAPAGHARLSVTPPFAPTTLVSALSAMPAYAGGPGGGGGGGGPGGASAAAPVAADSFEAEPIPSVAVTRTRNESPTFLSVSGSVLADAPGMSPQPLLLPKHRCHW